LVSILIISVGPILDKLYPRNIFCWGKAESEYEQIVGIREKIVWGVAIAFVIGVAASLFVYVVTK
jgi:hypothetical protein